MTGRIVNKAVPLQINAFSTLKAEVVNISVDVKKKKAYIKVNFFKGEKVGQFEIEYYLLSSQIAKVGKDYVLLEVEKGG